MTSQRPVVTDGDVLEFLLAGCNAAEIAAYAGIAKAAAIAWIGHVLHGYQRSAA